MVEDRIIREGITQVYQSIDDQQDEQDVSKPSRNGLIWVAATLGLCTVIAIVYLTSPGVSVPQEPDDFTKAELATYRKAISETRAPMRRARLQDFLTTYPHSERTPAVQAQLDVITNFEATQWIKVTNIIYDPKLATADKLTALENYETKWGGALLGGRQDEIKTIRESLTDTFEEEKLPNRKLKNQKSPIPDSVPDKTLAGGPKAAPPSPVFIPPTPIEPVVTTAANIVPPKVRRSVNPRYPRKAMRRKIEAVVTLKLNIDASGKVAMTELVNVQASKYEKSFIKAAERAALRTRFHPKTVNGKPTPAVGVMKRYRFKLGG